MAESPNCQRSQDSEPERHNFKTAMLEKGRQKKKKKNEKETPPTLNKAAKQNTSRYEEN